jgi:hypothetical protein
MCEKPDQFDWVKKDPLEKLGMGGFCKVVCEVLHDRLGDAEIWGFPRKSSFSHVYLMRNKRAIDIKGLRAVDEVIHDVKPTSDAIRITRQELAKAYFISDDDPESREIFKHRLLAYVEKNPARFGLD